MRLIAAGARLRGLHQERALDEIVGQVTGGLHVADGEGEEPGQAVDGARQPLDVAVHLRRETREDSSAGWRVAGQRASIA